MVVGKYEKEPYELGEEAYCRGCDILDCPYSEMEDYVERIEWISGWVETQAFSMRTLERNEK